MSKTGNRREHLSKRWTTQGRDTCDTGKSGVHNDLRPVHREKALDVSETHRIVICALVQQSSGYGTR